jgi:hypothetical protein
MDSRTPVKCPLCDSNDQIRKVTTVVNEGTASRSSEHWTRGTLPVQYPDVVASTDLAQRLRLPAPPSPTTEPGIESAMGCGAAIGLAIIGVIISVVTRSGAAVNICLTLGVLGSIGWVSFVLIRHNTAKRQAAEEMKGWPTVRRAWEDLYYCYRDDAVFLGSNPSKSAPSKAMHMLLTEEIG